MTRIEILLRHAVRHMLPLIEHDRRCLLEGHCRLDPDTLAPRLETLQDPAARARLLEYDQAIAAARRALEAKPC